MKRLLLASAAIVALVLPSTVVAAQQAPDDGIDEMDQGVADQDADQGVMAGGAQQVDKLYRTVPVDFVMSHPTCPNLPPDTTVNGVGTRLETTRTTVVHGVTTHVYLSWAIGTATDSKGNPHWFNYRNSFEVSNTPAEPDVFTGVMTDVFRLRGGPARLSNGFTANVTAVGGTLDDVRDLDPISQYGDPFNFEEMAPMCDPI